MSLRNSLYNMAARLSACTMGEQRSVICLFVVRGCETFWNLQKNESSVWRQLFEWGESVWWVERFQNGRQNVSDEHWSGRPVSVETETVKQQIEQWIHDCRWVTIDEIAVELNMCHGCAYSIVHDDLGYRKVWSRWVPRQLSNDYKRAWQTICQEHLDRHAREGDAFLHQIVTGDKTWVYHYEPESKRQSMQWKHPSSLASKKFKTQASAGKVMLTIFWDVNGPILVHFQENGQTVNSAGYSDMLVNKLKPAIRSKHRVLLSKRVLLLYDDARPHMAVHAVVTLRAQNLRCWNIHHTAWTWHHQTCLDLWKNICGTRSLQMTTR